MVVLVILRYFTKSLPKEIIDNIYFLLKMSGLKFERGPYYLQDYTRKFSELKQI